MKTKLQEMKATAFSLGLLFSKEGMSELNQSIEMLEDSNGF
jgi:hypothetical protein